MDEQLNNSNINVLHLITMNINEYEAYLDTINNIEDTISDDTQFSIIKH